MKYILSFILTIFFVSGLTAQTKVSYFNHTQVGFFIGEESYDKNQKAIIPSFQTVNGILFNEGFGLGIGIGAEPFEYLVIPVVVSGTVFMNKIKHRPFVTLKIGHAFSDSDKKFDYYSYGSDFKHKGGTMVNPELGVRFKMSDFDMTLSAGYRFQRLKSDTSRSGNYDYNHEVDYNRISFAIGMLF